MKQLNKIHNILNREYINNLRHLIIEDASDIIRDAERSEDNLKSTYDKVKVNIEKDVFLNKKVLEALDNSSKYREKLHRLLHKKHHFDKDILEIYKISHKLIIYRNIINEFIYRLKVDYK